MQQAMRGNRRGERIDACVAPGLAHIGIRGFEFVQRNGFDFMGERHQIILSIGFRVFRRNPRLKPCLAGDARG
jgi:hypothetical protein